MPRTHITALLLATPRWMHNRQGVSRRAMHARVVPIWRQDGKHAMLERYHKQAKLEKVVVLGRGGKSGRKAKRWCLEMQDTKTVLKSSLHVIAHVPLLFFFLSHVDHWGSDMCDLPI